MIDRPLPCVVDTNVVMRDALRFSRTGHTALWLAGRAGALKSFASVHVIDEVAEHLPDLARRQGVTNALEAWKTYSRNITFVEPSTGVLTDERVAKVEREDKDDLPTAILVVSLAPCISLSEDAHLTNAGLASPNWLRLALSTRDVAYARAIRDVAGLGLAGTGLTVAKVIKLIAKAAGSPVGQLGLAAATVAVGVGLRRSQTSGWHGPRKAGDLAAQALAVYLTEAFVSDQRRADAERLLRQALVYPIDQTTQAKIARVLALADAPMTATEVARSMVPDEVPLPRTILADVQSELARSSMVRNATSHRWELVTWEVA